MRLVLIDRAERTIDAKYFLMKPDTVGLVFVSELLQSAERGVHVRLLLDDIFTTVDDSVFILLNEHPNIEMRLFNPISRKGIYAFNYIGHFSFATNNHTSVHSAYATYRKRVLKAGVELWEARVNAAEVELDDGTTKSERLTLHTKGIIIDRRYLFVGSLNLDPRSIDINTEMGVMIDSEPLARQAAELSLAGIPGLAYSLRLDEKGRIRWHATIDGQEVVETKEPDTSGWMRFKAWFLKIAPEKQL